MKVIATDNLCREIPDKLVAENLSPDEARRMAGVSNQLRVFVDTDWLYMAVEDDYKLFTAD